MGQVSEELLSAAGMSESEFLKEIAVFFFQCNKVSLGKAAQIAGMTRLEFQKMLMEKNIPVNYNSDEFREDIETLNKIAR